MADSVQEAYSSRSPVHVAAGTGLQNEVTKFKYVPKQTHRYVPSEWTCLYDTLTERTRWMQKNLSEIKDL